MNVNFPQRDCRFEIFGCDRGSWKAGCLQETVDVRWSRRETAFGELSPGVKGVVISARIDGGPGLLDGEGLQVFVELVLPLADVLESQ